MPSTLERLGQLIRLLAGKQLVFLLDYDGCAAALDSPSTHLSSVLARFITLFPTAIMQRSPAQGEEENPVEAGASPYMRPAMPSVRLCAATDHLGEISGVQIVSYGAANSRLSRTTCMGSGEVPRLSTVRKTVVLGVSHERDFNLSFSAPGHLSP